MSTDYRYRAHVLWITLQQLLVFTYPGLRPTMAIPHSTPYVSEFEYASRFHPSRNPDCPTSGWSDNSKHNSGAWRYQRSPEEGSPVGQEPSIEVRAILVRCPKTAEETDDVLINRNVYNITAGRSQDILDFHGFDRDEPAHHSEVRDCRRKLIITMKFNNIGRTKTQEEFVVIDHVLDPVTMHKARLLNPFVVKVRQEPVLQLYGLKFQGVVNAEAREEVMNKKLSNYTGCDDSSDNPTCGQMIFEGKPIPYSQGFCCSCDPELNVQRQTSLLNESVASSFSSFFSRSKDERIRPFKRPRSVNTNFDDSFPYSEETDDVASPNEVEKKESPRSNYESLSNSRSPKFDQNFEPNGNRSLAIDGLFKDEQDLINLKDARKAKIENQGHPNWKAIFDEVDDKNTIAPNIVFSPPATFKRRSNSSRSDDDLEITDKSLNNNQIFVFQSSGKETFPIQKSTTDLHTSSLQNLRSVNLAAELSKLEEDYKNLRASSLMRAAERNKEAFYSSLGNNSIHRTNFDDARNLAIEQPDKEFVMMNHNDYSKSSPNLEGNILRVPLKDTFYSQGSTVSIDIKLALIPKEESTIPSSSIAVYPKTCSRKTFPPATMISSSFGTETPSVLWQKLVSDRVFPANDKSNLSVFDSFTMQDTPDSNKKFEIDVVDLLADAVRADDNKNSSNDHQESNNDRATTLEEMYNSTSFVNSITESSVSLLGTTDYLQGTEYPEASIDNPSNREESHSDLSTSFSSGNHSKDDAILWSGSLKNQLANWLPNDERNNSELESEKKLEMHVGKENEVEDNGEVGNVQSTILPKTVNKLVGPIRHPDLTGTFVEHRRPVEVHLSIDSPVVEEKIPQRKNQRDGRVSQHVYLENFSPEVMKFISRKKSRHSPRSYRSIAEDDSVFDKDNDHQRSIDKQIEDEFEEISDALKEAADGPTVVREKAKSDSTFEQDNSIARKFAKMFKKNSSEDQARIRNHLADFDENQEVRTELSKHTEAFVEPVSEIMLTTGPQIIVDRFKLINDFQEIPAGPQKVGSESSSDVSNMTNVSSKLRDRKQEEFPREEILQTTDHEIIVDRFQLVKDFGEKSDKAKFTHQSSSTIHNLGHEKQIAISRFKSVSANNNAALSRSALSPLLMIENLKKELRKEAERYSSFSRSTAGGSDFKGFAMHSGVGNEVREINTELTPAERVEDLVTDEETLPPDEETKYTTDALSKATSQTTKGTSSIERITINETVFPRLSIQSFDAKFINDNHALPLKRANEISILLEDPLSSSQQTLRRGNKRNYKKRLHRRRNRRKNHHNKRSVEGKGNIGDAMTDQPIVKGKNENEDDEHPWYETTIKSEATNAKTSFNEITTMLVKSTTLALNSLQNRKRRFDIETLSKNPSENDQQTESSNVGKQNRTAGNFHLSITKIPQSDYHGSKAGLRIEEISKNTQQESASTSDSIEAKLSSMKWTEKSGEVDEMPLFRDTKNRSMNNLFESQITRESSGRSKRNLQTLSGREKSDKNNKRNDLDSHESEPEALIFYDYEAGIAADHENHNEESIIKSSASISKDPNLQMISKRKSLISRNHRVDGRSNFFRKDITTESSASLDPKERSRSNCSSNKFGIEPSDGWKEKMELLKLKKHADVLKEYLNWRQDVALPEIQGVPGYTTRISLTNAKEEETTDMFTTDTVRGSEKTTLPSTYSTVTKEFTSTDEQRTDTTEFASSKDENYAANITTASSETLEILQSNSFGNCSSELLTTTVEVQTSTGCPDNKTEGNFRSDDETSTGRILPPCGYQNSRLTTCRIESGSKNKMTRLTSHRPPDLNRGHQKQLSDLDKDLIIISVLEKSLLESKKQFDAKKHEVASSKIHRIHNDVASAPILQHRRRHHKSRNNKRPIIRKSSKIRYNRRPGRQLMSFEDSDESKIDEDYDLTFEDNVENNYIDSSNEKDNFNGEEKDSETWNKKWNQMIDKIIHDNSSNSWKSENASSLSVKEIDSDSRSAMKQLHFNNADKYIRQIAKKIVHNTNIHEKKHGNDRFVDKSKPNRGKGSSRRHRPETRNQISKRKLQSYPLERRKVTRKAENSEDSGNYEDKRSASRVESKTDDSYDDQIDSSVLRSYPAPRSADTNATSATRQISEQDKVGRDFAISLSGKIHVEGGMNGQPMSISFDTSPEISNDNDTKGINSNVTSKLENAIKTDGEIGSNTNFLSSLFNIASVPKDLTNHPQEDKNSSSNTSIRQSVRQVGEERRESRENHRQKLRRFRKYPKIRKSRAVDEEFHDRLVKNRDDRSYRELEDIDEENELEDYPEASVDDNYSNEAEYEDAPIESDKRRSAENRNSYSAAENQNIHSPDIKLIKIIPIDSPKSSSYSRHGDNKANRMTASQMPKMEDDYVPGRTVKPGKIKSWRGNEDERNSIEDNFPSRSGTCSSEENPENVDSFNESSNNRPISTSNPVNLRVIGLVSMNHASSTSAGDSDTNSGSNYEIVPLVHVKIEQQAENTEKSPSRPVEEGCPAMEMPNSQDSQDDQSPCSRLNGQDGGNTRSPEVVTLNMDNDEELREPIQGGSCSGFNRKDSENLADHSNDDKANRTLATEVLSPCSGNREMTTTAKTRLEETQSRTDSRKAIRMKNMLAIVQFMKKIKELMNGDDEPELPERNNKDIVIKFERVLVLPNNRSMEMPNKIGQPEESTDNVVMMGEGVRHKPASDGIYFERNFRLPGNDDYNETNSPSNSKDAEKDRDKSFLFYDGKDKPEAANQPTIENSNVENPANDGKASEADHRHKIRLIEKLRDAENVVNPGNNEENLSSESEGEKNSDSNESQSNNRADLRNIERKINDRLRNLRGEDRNRDVREDSINNSGMNKRKSIDDFSFIRKAKRHRSPMRLRSNRMRYEIRNERDAKSQIYRRRSLPTGREVSRFSDKKFERYAAAKGIPKEKRTKKKKKKHRRRKKKKRKKKKKGKSHREAAVKGKAWWPFGRQLMSVSEERGLILNSNFERSQVERVKTKRQGNRRISLPFEARKRRRVHRAKYPHKSKKKRRKHKKAKRKKKKKKTKGRVGEKSGMRSKRQIKPGGTQIRGGQDCMDRRHPSNVNPAKYLESAHCLRFSDMWYSVYELEDPIMEHMVYLQLFEKHSLEDGTTHWDDLTQGTMVRMGTFTRHQRDSEPTIVFTYSGAKMESQKRALNLDPAKQRLLVPSPVSPKKSSQYPEAKSGLGEYLVVQTNTISKDGNACDKAGVGFAAFSKQEDRCGRAKGSCLRNQPLAYWRHDTEARESGRPGCYFLSNFATVPMNPIKYNVSGSGSREYLGLEYHSAHVSAIDIEVRTDYNAIVRVGSSGRVTEVYVDSTALEHTVVTVVISNMGLASSPYQPRITDCPTGLPISWTKAKGIMQVIPPQHDQRVTLDLYGQLLINGFHCSVEVINHRGELVAMRRIRVQKMDRCFCVWHCLCACIGSVSGMGCQPMSPEHYHAAGFQGPVPVVTTETSILMNAVKDVLMLSALLILLLLLLGMLKWFVGMFVPAVGRWGLDTLLDGSRIEKYLEPELQCRCVVTDDDGAPVHPDTGERTVRICSRKLEFFLNLIFFLTYPIAVCCGYFRKSLNASRQRNCCPDESKMCLINEKGSCPKMICVSTYGDSRNSKLEAEDTRYVMNELKKSQESLEHPRRTKKKEGHRNSSGKNLSKKSSRKNKSASDVAARKFVDQLLKKRMVFRNLTEPIGGLVVPAGTSYSLRGYFLNAENGGYRFITPCPFKQHWLIVNNQKKASTPPKIYPSNQFMRLFVTARNVYESNELSLSPQGICLNVQYFEDN